MSFQKIQTVSLSIYNSLPVFFRFVLAWFALVVLFRFCIPCIVNDVLHCHYSDTPDITSFHWINAIGYATLLVCLYAFHYTVLKFKTFVHDLKEHEKKKCNVDNARLYTDMKRGFEELTGTYFVCFFIFFFFFFVLFVVFGSIYITNNYGCYTIAHLLTFICIGILVVSEFVDMDAIVGAQLSVSNETLTYPRDVCSDEQIRAYRMTQIRVRGRIISQVNALRLKKTSITDMETLMQVLFSTFPYVPSYSSICDAAEYMKEHGVDMDVDDGEYSETRDLIFQFVLRRNGRLIGDAIFSEQRDSKTLDKILCHYIIPYETQIKNE